MLAHSLTSSPTVICLFGRHFLAVVAHPQHPPPPPPPPRPSVCVCVCTSVRPARLSVRTSVFPRVIPAPAFLLITLKQNRRKNISIEYHQLYSTDLLIDVSVWCWHILSLERHLPGEKARENGDGSSRTFSFKFTFKFFEIYFHYFISSFLSSFSFALFLINQMANSARKTAVRSGASIVPSNNTNFPVEPTPDRCINNQT